MDDVAGAFKCLHMLRFVKMILLMAGAMSAGWLSGCNGQARAEGKMLLAYYPSWSAKIEPSGAFDAGLANLTSKVHIVALAFVRPDAAYSGGDLAAAGLETPYGRDALKASIRKLRRSNPHVKVLASVGGATYANWEKLDAANIAHLVRDLGLDGIDVDFEPHSPNCRRSGKGVVCDSDDLSLQIIRSLRAALPRPAMLAVSLVNVGAYGEGHWAAAKPAGSRTYGLNLAMLRDAASMKEIDLVSIMAYDAGPSYRPEEALAAVQHSYKGPILMGFTPPPEAWGGHRYSTAEIVDQLQNALRKGAAGAMLFSIGKATDGPPSPASPDSAMMIETISTVLRGSSLKAAH
jgi:chitinase